MKLGYHALKLRVNERTRFHANIRKTSEALNLGEDGEK